MLKARMGSRRVDVLSQPELTDPAQPLKPGMLHHVEEELIGDGDETIDRIVDMFLFVDDLGYIC